MENIHTSYELEQMQSLPLTAKIRMTEQRIRSWYDHFDGQVYVSFSGGKDSTVLKHIVDSMYTDVPAVFVNTGLEYPEIQRFVNDVKNGKYECFNSDVEILRPEKRFDEVIKNYGYPVIGKKQSRYIRDLQNASEKNKATVNLRLSGYNRKGIYCPTMKLSEKWKPLKNANFKISEQCCTVMKKKPLHSYTKRTDRKPFIATMADESELRKKQWIKHGCNAFTANEQKSQPLSFWTENDILSYIQNYNVPYCSVYGDIVETGKTLQVLNNEVPELKTTGCKRTGCMFCMYGLQLEKEPNRFQRMKETHPKQYKYCMKSVNEGGLGLKNVIDYINEVTGTNIKY